MLHRTIGAALGVTLLAGVGSAQFNTIAQESFDYADGAPVDAATGGLGWFQQWFASCCFGSASGGVITSPGFDGIGNKVTMTANNEGAFRSPRTGTYNATIAPNFNFGEDGTTIWVSFTSARTPGADNRYGGLSLHTSFVGEKLFLGAPFDAFEWGIGTGATVAGSSVDTPTRLVYRIDYMPGDERLRLWLDPAEAHPTTTPDLDAIVPNHDWNEIRLQAGEGPTTNSWDFDDIVIEAEGADPNPETTTGQISLASGGTQTLVNAVGDAVAGEFFVVLGSASGTAPGTPFGSVTIPLNIDAYLNYTLASPNLGPFTNSFGTLDAIGWALTDITLPAGTDPALAGTSLDHALCVLQIFPSLDVTAVNDPLNLQLVP